MSWSHCKIKKFVAVIQNKKEYTWRPSQFVYKKTKKFIWTSREEWKKRSPEWLSLSLYSDIKTGYDLKKEKLGKYRMICIAKTE